MRDLVNHPNLSDQVNRNIQQSQIEGGAFIKDLALNRQLQVQTRNTLYSIQRVNEANPAQILIKGHPRFCPTWTAASLHGSTWGGSMIKVGFVGRGMRMEFSIKGGDGGEDHGTILTSTVSEVTEIEKEEVK